MGGLVPATLAGHTTPETAVAADGTLSIKFAQDGSDAGFIQSVPLKFSATGEAGSYVSEIPNGWTYVKTDTEIIFTNPGNSPTPLYVQFDPIGTRYETAMGTFASARELYEQCLQLWVLQQCAGQHKKFPRIGVVPAQQHQRLAYVEMALPSSVYYASVGASGVLVREFSGASKVLVGMVEIRHRILLEHPAVAALNLTVIGMRRTGLLHIIHS